MKTEKEILELLLKGKKIRKKRWNPLEYVKLNESGNLIDEMGASYSLFSLNCSDECDEDNEFVEYIEYVNFNTALDYMSKGGKAKRYSNNARIKFSCDSNGRIIDDYGQLVCLAINDYKANDWILL